MLKTVVWDGLPDRSNREARPTGSWTRMPPALQEQELLQVLNLPPSTHSGLKTLKGEG